MHLGYRYADIADAAEAADLHLECWRQAYGPLIGVAAVEARFCDREAHIDRWQEQIAAGPPRLLALDQDRIVGFAVAGPSRDSEPSTPLELFAIYLHSDYHGSGAAQALLDRAVPPGAAASLWVLADNHRARAFYTRNRFTPDGAVKTFDPYELREIRYTRRSTNG